MKLLAMVTIFIFGISASMRIIMKVIEKRCK